MFGGSGKVIKESENIKSVGSFLRRPIKTRINKGANTLFGFFLILRVY
jgi:hypothetical protein